MIRKADKMRSLLGQDFRASSFLYRTVVAMIVLAITLAVSIIWEKMVYTIPVLAALLFLAAGLKGISGSSTRRNLDQDAVDLDVDLETGAGMDAG